MHIEYFKKNILFHMCGVSLKMSRETDKLLPEECSYIQRKFFASSFIPLLSVATNTVSLLFIITDFPAESKPFVPFGNSLLLVMVSNLNGFLSLRCALPEPLRKSDTSLDFVFVEKNTF